MSPDHRWYCKIFIIKRAAGCREEKNRAEFGDDSMVSKMGIRCLKRNGGSEILPHFSVFSRLCFSQ